MMSEINPLTDDDLKSVANYVAEQEEGLHGLTLVLGNGTPINRLLATIEAYKAEVEGASPSAEQVARAVMIASSQPPTTEDKKLAAEACLLISGHKNLPNEGDMVLAVAEMIRDHRALKTTPTGGE